MATTGVRVFGRERELRQLTALLDDARRGRGRAAFVVGEAGIGKTTLAEALAEVAEARGAQVAVGRCTVAEAPPAWPWLRVLDAVDPAMRAELVAARETDRPAVLASIVDGLRTAVARALTLVVIEDLHVADAMTRALTAFVAAAVPDMHLMLLITGRDEPAGDHLDDALDEGALPTSVMRMRLTGVDVESARDLIAGVIGTPVDDALAHTFHARTGGNPFFVEEVARLWAMRGQASQFEVPPAVSQVLLRRFARLSQPAVTLLGAASILGDIDNAMLAAMTDQPEDAVLTLLAQAQAIGAVRVRDGEYAFAHDLVRDSLKESLAPVTRTHLHRRAAEALELLRPAEHGLIAAHWRDTGGQEGNTRAAAHARQAAEAAMRALGFEQAIRYYRWALDGDADDRPETMVGLGEAQVLAGDLTAARSVLRDAALIALKRRDGETLARAVLAMGTGVGGFEVDIYDDEQRTLLEQALQLLPERDSSLRAAVQARHSLACALAATIEERVVEAQAAVAMAARAGDRAVEVSALAALCDALSGPGHVARRTELTERMLQLARQSGNAHLVLLTRRLRVVVMLERGDFAGVDREIAEYDGVAARLHVPVLQWPVPVWRGMRALMRGDATEAQRWSDVAEDVARRARSPNADMMVGTLRIAIERSRGQGCEPLALLPAVTASLLDWYVPAWCLLAACYAEAGRLEEARAFLRRVMEHGTASIDDDSERLEALWNLGDAAIILGDRPAAEAAAEALAPYAHLWAVDGIGGACFGCVGDQLGRLDAFLGSGSEAPGGPAAVAAPDQGVVTRRGEVWEISWRGDAVLVKDTKGLRDIVSLLERPGVGVPAIDLVAAGGGPSTPEGNGGIEVLDVQARSEYRERIRDLEREMADADDMADVIRLANAKAEHDVLLAELARALGLGGRSRRDGDRTERARKAVTMRIASAVRTIESANPDLGRHLRASVETGRVCTYAPERPASWTVLTTSRRS